LAHRHKSPRRSISIQSIHIQALPTEIELIE
jgi:ribosomal protein L20A (L18A)